MLLRRATNHFKTEWKLENVAHKPAIEEEHLQQLKAGGVFSLYSPLSLLGNVWFHIVLFFTDEVVKDREP